MDGRDRSLDNIIIARPWRSLKYEAVDLHKLSDRMQAQRIVPRWFAFVIPGMPTKRECCQRCRPSAAACLLLCRLNRNS